MRLVSLLARAVFGIALLLLAACGPEAPSTSIQPTAGNEPTARPASTTAAIAAEERPRPSGVTPLPDPTLATLPTDAPVAVVAGDPREQGDPAAPITIVEYSDFQ